MPEEGPVPSFWLQIEQTLIADSSEPVVQFSSDIPEKPASPSRPGKRISPFRISRSVMTMPLRGRSSYQPMRMESTIWLKVLTGRAVLR